MKKSILTAMIMALCTPLAAMTNIDSTQVIKSAETDSTLVINRPNKVHITDGENFIKIVVEGKEDNDAYKYSIEKEYTSSTSTHKESDDWNFKIPFSGDDQKSKNKPFKPYIDITIEPQFGIGLVSATGEGDGVDLPFSNGSFEFILDELLDVEYHLTRKSYINFGFGVNWRNYRMTGDKRFVKEINNIVLKDYPDGAEINFSRIKIFSLTFSMILKHNINKNFGVGIGPVLNINTGGNIKTRWRVDGTPGKDRYYDIHQNFVTVDFKGIVYIKPFSLYFKYSPTNVISKNRGPEFRSMSAGILLGL